jgi:hypothetical protein
MESTIKDLFNGQKLYLKYINDQFIISVQCNTHTDCVVGSGTITLFADFISRLDKEQPYTVAELQLLLHHYIIDRILEEHNILKTCKKCMMSKYYEEFKKRSWAWIMSRSPFSNISKSM